MADQFPVTAAAMRAQASQELYGFQQVGFPLSVGSNHQQTGSLQSQLQLRDVAKLMQVQAFQPDGSEAMSR